MVTFAIELPAHDLLLSLRPPIQQLQPPLLGAIATEQDHEQQGAACQKCGDRAQCRDPFAGFPLDRQRHRAHPLPLLQRDVDLQRTQQ